MLNEATIMGRFTADPELRYTQAGTPCCSFTLAVERDFKGQGGERETDFIDLVAWSGTAEFVAKYFRKGRMAVARGPHPDQELDRQERPEAQGHGNRGGERLLRGLQREGTVCAGAGVRKQAATGWIWRPGVLRRAAG